MECKYKFKCLKTGCESVGLSPRLKNVLVIDETVKIQLYLFSTLFTDIYQYTNLVVDDFSN